VPNVVNLSQAAAQSAITAATLTIGTVTQAYSATVPAGSVISQNPAAGAFAAPGSAVDLVISSTDPVPDPFGFTSLTGVATGFATASNAVTITGITGPAPISISGGNTPYYSVSTDNGITWSTWSATTPATVSPNDQVKVRQTSSALAFTTTTTTLNVGGATGSFSVTTGYSNPPSWMPMSMLSVAFDSVTERLSVVDEATKLGAGVYPAMNYVAAGSYDPAKPWGILNGGMAISRQLGWDDPTAQHGNGITPTGQLVIDIASKYGAEAGIWIELISQSPGLETWFADGMWGVGGTGNAASGTPQVYTDANGFPIIYDNNYYGIFGTNGSSNRWRWDGSMIHNVYAVPAAYITQPNQLFTATYRVYAGDSSGNEILNGDGSSASTVEIWTWKGPATVPDNVPDPFSFISQTGVSTGTEVESNIITVSGIAATSLISITGGDYSVSSNGGADWSAWSATTPATVANGSQVKVRQTSSASHSTTTTAVLTIGGVSGEFNVTTAAPATVTVPNVTGFTQGAAESAITAAGLTVGAVSQEYSATVPAGLVISQNPLGGASVLPGNAVNLLVSRGPAPVAVPNVVNLSQAAAQSAITAATLTIGNVTQAYSATVPAGSVISQNPAAGLSVIPGSAVNLVVSKGPAPVTVPNVVGLTQAAAQTAITAATLKVGTVTKAYSATVPAGRVISQNPLGGAAVLTGSSVNLVVSKGSLNYRISGLGYNFPESTKYKAIFTLDINTSRLSSGWLTYYYTKTRMSFISKGVSSLSFNNGTYTATGTGKVNGRAGYTFIATIKTGSPDTFGIEIRKPDGSVYYKAAPKILAGGDIVVIQKK
jgi:beta-lactam-binding protein with PASTA domain